MMLSLGSRDALLIVDVQNDFLPGGSLGIAGGDAMVPILNEYLGRALGEGARVFVVRDWHPPGHCSFVEQGGPWPQHCVQGTRGAEFAAELRVPAEAVVVSKGSDLDRDAYSAFEGTKLDTALSALRVRRILIGGLATDYCVLHTVLDARARGYDVLLLDDAIAGVDAARSLAAREQMLAAGAVPVTVS
jgi:nicotinamidase/pyrazinamidase